MKKANNSTKPKTKQKPTVKKRFLSVLTYLIPLLLMYWFFFILLPSKIDVAELKSTLQSLSLSDHIALLIAGILSILAVG